jgi:hypothetical protein
MTISEALTKIDELKPNGYSQNDKVSWLSTLDGMVFRQIFDTHEDSSIESFAGYNEFTSLSTELLITDPYAEECYMTWLEAKIDSANNEYTKYNNSIIRFTDAYRDFANDYNRHHIPKGKKIRYF